MTKENETFNVVKIKERIEAAKAKELKPILDRIETLKGEIAELESQRDELEDLRDSLQGVVKQPTKRRSAGKSSGGTFDVDDDKIVAFIKTADKPKRADIMEHFGLATDDDGLKVKVSATLGRLVDDGRLKKGGSSRGTFYSV